MIRSFAIKNINAYLWQLPTAFGHCQVYRIIECLIQGRPVNVKHGASCAMDKVGGREDKNPEGRIFYYRYKFAVIGKLPFKVTAWIQNCIFSLFCCTEWAKKTGPQTHDQFLIDLRIFLLEDSLVNLQLNGYQKSHHTLHMLLHYLVKH